MGLFDWFSGGVPREAQSSNRALQKQANRLEDISRELQGDAHSANPFARSGIHEIRNELRAHRKQVQNFKDQPGYPEFRDEASNRRFILRLDDRDQLTKTELGVKETIASWELSGKLGFNLGIKHGELEARTRPELPPSTDEK